MDRRIRIVIFSILGVLLFTQWYFLNNSHLVQRAYNQLFQLDFEYFLNAFSRPGGLSIYLGEWFVSSFYSPVLGAVIMTGLLLGGVFLTYIIFRRVTNSLLAFFFGVFPSLCYGILLTDNFYYVSGFIAFLHGLGGFYIYQILRQKKYLFFVVLLSLLIYWFAGAALYLFLGLVGVSELFRKKENNEKRTKGIWLVLTILFISFFVPLFARQTIFLDNLLQSYVSRAFYKVPVLFPWPLVLILILPTILLAVAFLISKTKNFNRGYILLPGLVIVVVLFAVMFFAGDNVKEEKYHYDQMVFEQRWEDIIELAKSETVSEDREISVAVNMALTIEGRLSTEFFKIKGLKPVFHLPYERKGKTPFMSSEPYFYLGLNNFSRMMAMESLESTIDAKIPSRSAKRVAETFIVSRDSLNAMKYLNLLKDSPRFGDWANQYLGSVKSGNWSEQDSYAHLNQLGPQEDFYYNSNQFYLSLIYLLRGNVENRMAYEYLMMHYLLEKDFDNFLKFISIYPALNYREVPVIFQEAKVYIETLSQAPIQELSVLPVSVEIRDNLRRYAQTFSNEGRNNPEMMKKEFGETYWYYLHFGGDDE